MKSEIVKSEFNLVMVIAMMVASILLVGFLLWITYMWFVDKEEIEIFQRIMITFFPLLLTPLLFKIEIPKIKKLKVDAEGLTIVNPIFSKSDKLDWKDIDGYQSVFHFTKGGTQEELMIIADNKVIYKVSENYIKNYTEVKRALTRNLKNLGAIEYKYFKYIKRRLLRR